MEGVKVKEEEEDWSCNVNGNAADLEVKQELDLGVDIQSASASTVPTLFNDSPTIKQEPTDTTEDADTVSKSVTNEEDSTLHNKSVCDTTEVKVEDAVTEADVWLQRLARAWVGQEEALDDVGDDNTEEYDEDAETAVAAESPALPKRGIPVTLGTRKFILVHHATGNVQPASTNHTQQKVHERAQLSAVTKFIMPIPGENEQNIHSKNIKIKPVNQNGVKKPSVVHNGIAQPVPAAGNVITSIPPPAVVARDFIPGSEVASTATQYLLTKKTLQSPSKSGVHIVQPSKYGDIPNCILPTLTKKTQPDETNSNLKPVLNNVLQRSVAINRILDQSVSKNHILPTMVTKKIPPPDNGRLKPQSDNNFFHGMNDWYIKPQVLRKLPKHTQHSQKLLKILEALKVSKRAEAFIKVPCVPIKHIRKSHVVANVEPSPQQIKIKPTTKQSVDLDIAQILTYVNSKPPQPIETKSTLKPITFINSIPFIHLEAFLRPCFVRIDRLKPLTCAVCRQQFYLKSQFVQHVFQHVKTASATPNYPCKICGKRFQRTYLKIHERKAHEPKKFWCAHCDRKCADKASLIKHLVIHSDNKPFRCDVCNKRFRTKSNLVSHQKMHSFAKPYGCVICDKRFRRKNSLSKHSLSHLATRPYICKICDKQFCEQFHLERHMLVHTGERPFACEICNMRFTRNCHRDRHMVVHMRRKKYTGKQEVVVRPETIQPADILQTMATEENKELPMESNKHICKICNEHFEHQHQLKKHKSTHSENRFFCTVCNKQLKNQSSLDSHKWVHVTVRPFSCKYCYKSFKLKGALTTHERTHTGDKPYICKRCNKEFTQQTSLNNHMLLHKGIKPYPCPNCPQQFTQISNLRQHSSKFHSNDNAIGTSIS